jgi:hypothetical protein
MKVAKLVIWSPCVRVVVDEDATYEDILAAAKHEVSVSLREEFSENIEAVMDDEECPYKEN